MTIALEIKQEEKKTITNTKALAEYLLDKSADIEDLSDEKREKMDAQITAKLKAGKKLSPKELAYLRRTNPSMYAHAMRVQKMAEAIEERIKHAKSKQEADNVIISSLNGISKNDPDREYIVAAVNRISSEMHKSSAYNRLPNTDIEAQKSRKSKKEISFESAEDDEDEIDLDNWSPLTEIYNALPKFAVNA